MLSKQKGIPRVWVVSGPSGSGKTTLCKALLGLPTWGRRLLKSVSYTTRPLRSEEKAGEDYVHVSEKKFLQLLQKNAFLEHEKIFGSYYGTPKLMLTRAARCRKDLLLCIDVKGAQAVRQLLGENVVSIFIAPPEMKTLGARLRKRSTESKKDIHNRLKRVKMELAYSKDYDYRVVNGDFKEALNTIKAILKKESHGVRST